MDRDKLLRALDDETNEKLLNFNTKKLYEMNLQIISELNLNIDKNNVFMKKLQGYKYVDELNDLKYGTYIRWINLTNPKLIEMEKGGFFCQTKIKDDGVYLTYKNAGYTNKHYQIKLDECLVFQKLTQSELVLISALDFLSTSNI